MEEMKDVKVIIYNLHLENTLSLSEVSHNRFYTICDQQQESVEVDGERQVLEDSFKPSGEEVHVENAALKQQK
jgi:hypothetical protein